MSNRSKSRNNAKQEIKKTESASTALAVLGGHAKRIEQSQAELEKVERGLKKTAAMKRKHPSTVRPDSPGTVRGKKAPKLKNGEDSPSKNCLEPSDNEDQPKPRSRNGKMCLPSFNDVSEEEAKSSHRVEAQGEKGKGKAAVKVAPIQETIVILDSKSMQLPKSEKSTKKNKTKAPPIEEAKKFKGPLEKNKTKAPPVQEASKVKGPSEAFKKNKTKAPPVEEAKKSKGPSERKKEKTKAPPVNEASKVNGPDIDKDPNVFIDEVLKPSTGRQVSDLMSGTRLRPPTGMSNSDTTNHTMAVGSGSLTVSSHASIHTLQLAILALEDSMRRTTAMEALLNVELQKLGRRSVRIPGFLPEEFRDISAPLKLVSHFHASQESDFRGNHSLSLFGVVREAARDEKVYPKAEVVPIPSYDQLVEDGSQEEVKSDKPTVAPDEPVVDRGEGSSRGYSTLRVMADEDEEEEDSSQGHRVMEDDEEEEDSSRGRTTSGVTEDDDEYDDEDDD